MGRDGQGRATPFGYARRNLSNAEKVVRLADDLIAEKIELTRRIAQSVDYSASHRQGLQEQLKVVDRLIREAQNDPVYQFVMDQAVEAEAILARLERQYELPSAD